MKRFDDIKEKSLNLNWKMMEIFLRFFVVMLPIHHGGLVHFLLLLLSSGARWLVTVADVPSWRRRRRSRQWCHNGRLIILSFFFF